jgi:hypothetical protein
VIDAEDPRDLGDTEIFTAKRERGGPADDLYVVQLAERVGELFGQAVAEILVVGVAAEVRERKDGHRVEG